MCPLTYDDIPGSWGVYSANWPKLTFRTEEEARNAYVVAWKHCGVPYGSYVLVGKELRLETEAYVVKVDKYLNEQ